MVLVSNVRQYKEIVMKVCKVEVEVPAGQYILGDPCYAVPDDEWMELLESCDYFENPIGKITRRDKSYYRIVAFSTRWGDGCYKGSDGQSYPVDAGLIGLVPWAVCKDVIRDDLSEVVTFDKPTKCSSDGEGKLRFGHITIDTDPADEEDEDE
jgi:hypothetical protein